ncbi:hypothetical protein D3C83_52780 [compost metagenome]
MQVVVLRMWPIEPGDRYEPMSLTQSRRMPRNFPSRSSASAPSMMLPRPCVSVMKASARVETHFTGLPVCFAAIISTQYSG